MGFKFLFAPCTGKEAARVLYSFQFNNEGALQPGFPKNHGNLTDQLIPLEDLRIAKSELV